MATQSILVEDCSPLIQYAPLGAWQDAQANDTLARSYSGGSYHVTSTQGATATFQFRGIGLTITGARRPGYGPFSIFLDGQQQFVGNPTPASDSDIMNSLASFSGLPNDIHTVVLTNTGGAAVDIDAITFEVQIGDAMVTHVATIDDNDPRITYSPTDAWKPNPNPAFYDGSIHLSSAPNATASLQFTGNAIAFYGTVSPDHADVTITIDDKIDMTMPSGSASRVLALRPQVLMHWADDLGDGQHTMTITKVQNANTGPFVDVDSFVVYSSVTADNTTAPSTNPSEPTAVSKQVMNRTDVIIISSVAGVVAILLFIAGFFLFLKYRLKRRRLGNIKPLISPTTPNLPMQGVVESSSDRRSSSRFKRGNSSPLHAAFSPLRRKTSRQLSRLSVAPSYYGDPDFANGNEMSGRRNTSDEFTPAAPRLAVPRAPESLQTLPGAVITDATSSPYRSSRPSRPRRPPTLNIGSLDSLR